MSTSEFRDKLKTTIVLVARELLANEGLQGLQARRIAQSANCSVGTIYNLYGSLDMVVVAANAETLAELHDKLAEAAHGQANLTERLNAMAQTYLRFAVDRTLEWRAIFEHRFANKTTVPEWYRENQSELFALVEQALASDVNAEDQRQEAARALFSAVHGVIALALDEKLGDFDQPRTERQVSFIVNAVARGLSNPS